MATIAESMLRLSPRSPAMSRKKGPMHMRRPTVSSVAIVAPATIFQPKYQPPKLLSELILPPRHVVRRSYLALQTLDGRLAKASFLSGLVCCRGRHSTTRVCHIRPGHKDRRHALHFLFLRTRYRSWSIRCRIQPYERYAHVVRNYGWPIRGGSVKLFKQARRVLPRPP